MTIIDTGVGYAAAAYDASAKRLVIVAVNSGAAQNLTFDLSKFSQVAGAAADSYDAGTPSPPGAATSTPRTRTPI